MFSHETASFKACLKTLIEYCLTTFILGRLICVNTEQMDFINPFNIPQKNVVSSISIICSEDFVNIYSDN